MNADILDLFPNAGHPASAPTRELIIDSFAGGGGASTGIEMALGRSPDFGINHDAEALALHAANHPETVHLSENIWKVDPLDVVHGRRVGVAWFSPDCKHFSKAKGGAPVKKNIRDLAWVVVNWAKRARPRVIFVENVEEFQGWGPLDEHNQPCKDRKGETFKKWVKALQRLGYKVEWRELRACDYGATPLGIVSATMVQTGYGEREGQEPRALDIEKPLGTVVAGGQKHAAVAAFLAQHNNEAPGKGNPGRPADAPTSTILQSGSHQAVVSAGMINMKGSDQRTVDVETPVSAICAQGNHVAEVRAFLFKYYGNEEGGHSIGAPLGTVTTRDRFGIVTIEGQDYVIADIGMRMLNPRELYRAQGFPSDYKIEIEFNGKRLPKSSQTRMCGNSVCPPMAAALVAANCNDLAELREAAE